MGWTRLAMLLAASLSSVLAVSPQLFYPYGPRQGDESLPPADDISTDEIQLSVPIVFFNSSFSSIYVNLNGHVSFESEVPAYRGDLALPFGLKLIAPFMADIDTRISGRVYYREARDQETLQRAATDIHNHFLGKVFFRPSTAFIVTWEKVGYYRQQSDKVNTFQLVIVTDGESSFAIFQYLDGGMQWIKSQGKLTPTVPEIPAQAGFDSGSETTGFFLPGSGTTAAFVKSEVTFFEVDVARTCLEGARQCHINARCLDFDQGFCCQCLPPFYGNGKNCLERGGVFNRTSVINFQRGDRTIHTVRIMQRFFGHDALNNVRMDTHIEGDLPNIVLGSKISISDYHENYKRVSPGLIKAFSVRSYRVNDIAFRYTWDTTITFVECEADPSVRPDTMRLSVTRNYVVHNDKDQVLRYAMSNKVTVFTGTDACLEAELNCHEHADCIPSDDTYRCICKPGFDGSGIDCRDIDECTVGVCGQHAQCSNTIGSFQCQCLPGYQGDGRTCVRDQQMCGDNFCSDHARCVFNSDTMQPQCECNQGFKGNGILCTAIRFGCNEADICGDNAQCVLDTDTNMYVCECLDDFSGDGYTCERQESTDCDRCSKNAECVYDIQRIVYQCRCEAGYTGDGVTCTPLDRCDQCGANAECVSDLATGQYICRCPYGFYGDGLRCERYDCREANVCDINAECQFDTNLNLFLCRCKSGFAGDGFDCKEEGCDVRNDCDPNARCIPDTVTRRYKCQCNPGFQGDGKVCSEEIVPCNRVNNCDRYAECIYDPDALSYRCRCSRGYEGDGFTCRKRDVPDCQRDPSMCDPNASCVKGADGEFVCVCNRNFRGDGRRCSAVTREGDYLIYAQGYKVMRVPARADFDGFGQQIVYVPGQLAVGVDVDCQDGWLYWTDAAYGRINRVYQNGSASDVLVEGLGSPEGIAIDYVSRNIFFTDSKLDTLEVSRLDGSFRKTLFNTDMVNPRAIVLDPSQGVIFWTDWNRNQPQIETASMDGTNRRVLVSADLGLPNGLVFDQYSHQLCWTDAGHRRLECMRSDGQGRRVVSEGTSHPFDLTILNNILYWTDWNKKNILNVNQNGGDLGPPLPLAFGSSGRLYGITAVRDVCPRVTNACAFNNGGCTYLCLPTANGGRSCACPDGMDPRICKES
ncbi:hypothetical protein C0Q70_13762 [Pomacea canaliculata]|uniref:Uncharacterized protein n=1 Tax=Pomacea canaliculata TaxID=400727 RepID=A0A2T7NY56_POMCA|nr:hypothetical protein C0Q70_13762 [Pomacea canaliculata]